MLLNTPIFDAIGGLAVPMFAVANPQETPSTRPYRWTQQTGDRARSGEACPDH